MNSYEKIIKIIDAETLTVDEKMQGIKQAAVEEVRMQALKAFPAKAKLSTTLTKMYNKDNAMGYVTLDTEFALINRYYVVRIFGSSPAELLPNSAEEIKFTKEAIHKLFIAYDTDTDLHTVTVSYSDVIAHIKLHGRRRNKNNQKNLIFSIPNTGVFLNVLYLENAFKLAQKKELKVKIVDNKHPIYVQGNGWDMLIATITQRL